LLAVDQINLHDHRSADQGLEAWTGPGNGLESRRDQPNPRRKARHQVTLYLVGKRSQCSQEPVTINAYQSASNQATILKRALEAFLYFKIALQVLRKLSVP
jgi:hypothetical protein